MMPELPVFGDRGYPRTILGTDSQAIELKTKIDGPER